MKGSLVELGEKRMRIADRELQTENSKIKSFAQKNFKFPCNNLKFEHIYCKYLHGE